MATAAKLSETISTSEWLGPLAPVALSPYFGMACLAGLAQFGPDSLVQSNGFLSVDSPLKNPAVFWTFATLAVATSLPRLTKVSKPIAGALSQIESYSSIIALVAIRYLATQGGPTQPPVSEETIVYAAGIGSLSTGALLSIAAAINIVVINAVKFFFEFMIWLIPFPTIDAIFEAGNKAVVAGLMGLYSFSPLAATVLNLALFGVCAVVFIWTRRQVVFMRTMMVGWLLAWFRTGSPPKVPSFVVFPQDTLGPFAPRERLTLTRTADGFVLTKRKFFGGQIEHHVDISKKTCLQTGSIAHRIVLDDNESVPDLLMSRQLTPHLDIVAALLSVHIREPDFESVRKPARDELGGLSARPSQA